MRLGSEKVCESLGQPRISIARDCSREEARSGLTWSVLQNSREGGRRAENGGRASAPPEGWFRLIFSNSFRNHGLNETL